MTIILSPSDKCSVEHRGRDTGVPVESLTLHIHIVSLLTSVASVREASAMVGLPQSKYIPNTT